MVFISNATLAEYWIKYCELRKNGQLNNDFSDVVEEIYDLARRNPEHFWSIVIEVLSVTDDNNVLSILGIGPIEDLIEFHPNDALRFIKNQDEYRDKLKTVLSFVDQSTIDDEVWNEILNN